MTKILAIGMIILILSFPITAALTISDIGHSDVTARTARISWKTDDNSSTLVKYGLDGLDQSKEGAPGTLHEVELTELDAGVEYKYQVLSDDERSNILHFTTVDTRTNFLEVNALPETTTNRSLNISGETRQGSRLFVFLNSRSQAEIKEYNVGPDFSFQLTLDPGAYNNGTGINKIEVQSWDSDGNKDAVIMFVLLDETPPILAVMGIPSMTNRNSINISGKTEPGAAVEIYLKGSRQKELVAENGTFETEFELGGEGAYNVTVIARDLAGNEAKYVKEVHTDHKAPTIEWITNFQGTTHFKLYKIEGKTEPGSKVVVLNFGKYSGCDDPDIKTDYGGCDTFVRDTVNYDEFYGVIDPVTWAIGTKIETEADSDGSFSITVPLVPSEDDRTSVNNLLFTVTDPAGNTNDISRQVKYEPGCNDWHVGLMESYPYNIYTRELSEGNIEASTFFPIQYLGAGSEIKVTDVEIGKDRYNVKYLESDQQRMDQLFDMGKGARVSMFDTKQNQIYVYAPLNIKQYKGSLNDLPDELHAYMYVKITYSVDGNTNICDVFTTAAFDIHKPELISNWLSPTMINNTIHALDNIISVTETAVKRLKTASILGLVACGAMVAYNYISGFASSETTAEGECSQSQENMENTYWVCDRILCPNVPPECNDFDALPGEGYKINGETADKTKYDAEVGKWDSAYENYKTAENDPKSKEEWYRSVNADKAKEMGLTPWENMEVPSIYHTENEVNTPTGKESEETTIRYYAVKKGKITDNKEVDVDLARYQISVNVHSTLDTQAAQLGDGTLMVIYKTTSKWKASTYSFGEKVGEIVEIRQVRGQSPSQIGPPDAGRLQGCYNEKCPQFDNTKCVFGDDDEIPASDLWSSAKCVCLPGLLEHMKNYLQIMQGARKCLQQALIGEVRGGFCERLLAQFVCDLLIQAFKAVMDIMQDPGQYGMGDFGVRDKVQNYKTNSDMVTKQLSNRYGDIVKSKFGLTSDRIVNRACVVAFSGDWSLLEGVFDNFVEAIEVEPIAYVNAESRPYGFDPFSGRMNIGYNVYIGVVPGGETKIKAWLECNRNAPNGKYCGQNVENLEIRGFRNHLSKNDPPINQNIVFTDKGTHYWYNQVVLEVEYRIAGEWVKKPMTANIWQKGDLSASCHADLGTGEIMCDILNELMPNGIAELLSISQGTHLSPTVARYKDGDPVNALVKIRNSFADPFWLVVEYPNSNNKKMYKIEPNPGGNQKLEVYNIWLDSVSSTGGTSTGTNDQTWGPMTINKHLDSDFGIRIDSGLDSMDATILYSLKQGGAKSQKCTVYSDSQKSTRRYMAYVDGVPRTGKEVVLALKSTICGKTLDPGKCNLMSDTKFADALDRYDGVYYKCLTQYDSFSGFRASDVKEVASITYSSPKFHSDDKYNDFVRNQKMGVSYIGIGLNTEQYLTAKGVKGETKRTVSMNIYQDTNEDGAPDTPIIFSGGGGNQKIDFQYSMGASTNPKPQIDLVEPIGDYFNGGDFIPVGVNVWNVNDLKIDVKDRDGVVKCSVDVNVDSMASSGDCWKLSDRTTYPESSAPPFIEFQITSTDWPKESTDIYEITAQSGETKVSRKFAFDKSLTKDDVVICLGAGQCSSNWAAGTDSNIDLGSFDASAMPGVRVT